MLLDAHIPSIMMVPSPGLGAVIDFVSKKGADEEARIYKVSIGTFPECTCPSFTNMFVSFKGNGRGAYGNCKHLYYIFRVVCGLDRDKDRFVHAPTLSFNEIKRILLSGIVQRIPGF